MKQVSFGSRDLSNEDTGWLPGGGQCSKSTTAFSSERAPKWPLLALEVTPQTPVCAQRGKPRTYGHDQAAASHTRSAPATPRQLLRRKTRCRILGHVCVRCQLPFGLRSMPVTLRERHPMAPVRPHRNAAPTPLSCPSPTKMQYAQGPASSPRGSTRTTSPCPSAAGLEAWCSSEAGSPKSSWSNFDHSRALG